MTDMINQEVSTAETESKPERTFTQAEVDKIVEGRLYKERQRYSDYDDLKAKATKYDEAEEASKTELQKAQDKIADYEKRNNDLVKTHELSEIRARVSKETGVPTELLTADTEEACVNQAKAILAFAKPNSYPSVKDAGEVRKVTSGKTRDQFKDWFESNIK